MFVLGAILGSFIVANVGRLKRDDRSRWSHCLKCKHRLEARDLVPIWSWLRLGGKCRYCGAQIGGWEVFGEVLVGAVFALTYIFFPVGLESWVTWPILVIFLILLSCMLFLAFFDAKYKLFPSGVLTFSVICAIIYTLTAFALADGGSTAAFQNLADGSVANLWGLAGKVCLSVAILAAPYFLLYKLSREKWVGSGDWALMLAVAIVLADPFLAFMMLFLANFLASAVTIFRIKHRERQIPFGPFMVVAFWLIFLGQNWLLDLANGLL